MAFAMAREESELCSRWQRADVYRRAREAPRLRGGGGMRDNGSSGRKSRTVSGLTVPLEGGIRWCYTSSMVG